MMPRTARLTLVTLLASATVAWLSAAPAQESESARTDYWSVSPDLWRMTGVDPQFPETALDEVTKRGADLGVAFSGGGTRSAAATVGQLRGLRRNGWLGQVRYVAAVSGGAWAAIPFTFSPQDLDVLLGPLGLPPDPEGLRRSLVEEQAPKGSLARSIADSKLLAPSAAEASKIYGRANLDKAPLPDELRALARKFLAGSTDETYANLLGRVFVKPHVPGGTEKRYTWNAASRDRIKEIDPKLSVADFVTAADDRPFLIVGGSMIYMHPAYEHPRLIPVEMTPLYTGVRQQYGERLGGIYVRPHAYDVAGADLVNDHTVRVQVNSARRPFTIADMMATTGAAPLLTLFQGKPLPILTKGTAVFPIFNHFTIREDKPQPVVENLSHGDGGFTDNLGVMPLLARKVHNLIVFVNAKESIIDNPAVESLFWTFDRFEDGGGDRSMNHVFESRRFEEVKRGLDKAMIGKGAAVYCDRGWEVLKNEFYNVPSYGGLNICWVYNQTVPSWEKRLPADTREMLTSRSFRNFPWFSTFGQNIPFVIRLKPAQANLLADLTEWAITNGIDRSNIEKTLGIQRTNP